MAFKSSTKDPYVFKVRLYPNQEQTSLFYKTAGCCRKVYNDFLARKIKELVYWKETGKDKPEPNLPRYKEVFEFMKEVDSTALQSSTIDLKTAFKNCFKHGFGFPKFKKKGKDRDSFRIVMNNRLDFETSSLKIGKLGFIKFKGLTEDRFPQGTPIKSITVSRSSDNNWYASILVDLDTTIYDHSFKFESCGIDLGVVQPLTIFYTNSSGEDVGKVKGKQFSKDLEKKENKRKKYQRQYSRKKKGSKNQAKARLKVGKAFFKEAQFRKNYIEQTSNIIARTFEIVVMENLNIKSMTKTVKKTIDGSPRKGVSAKSGLNREMTRLSLGLLTSRIASKCNRYGGRLILVDPRYTSQTCPECGTIDKDNRKSQAEFLCTGCEYSAHADVNAARNIHNKGLLSLQ